MTNSYVYILSDESKALIIRTRMFANIDDKLRMKFCSKSLVYYEVFDNQDGANKRKETFEGWPEKKIKFLIDFVNPEWEDWKNEITN
jgi:predicted GIY-YIG superfamily endonuclease